MKTIKCTCGESILLDDDVPQQILSQRWTCLNSGSVRTGGNNYLVRCILPVTLGFTVDHKDRNKHNFQKDNLREATYQQQNFNRGVSKRSTTGFKGVSVDARAKRPFRAFICKNNHRMFLGSFSSVEEAAKVYDKKAKELFGEFAVTNFPI